MCDTTAFKAASRSNDTSSPSFLVAPSIDANYELHSKVHGLWCLRTRLHGGPLNPTSKHSTGLPAWCCAAKSGRT